MRSQSAELLAAETCSTAAKSAWGGLLSRATRLTDLNVAALEALEANVMIADNELRIVYLNDAIVSLLKEAQGELRRDLPNFDVSTLIGSTIDVFHKKPSHQRSMLRAMTRPSKSLIRVGGRAFDLLITPLMIKGRREGFVVEWADAAPRLLNLDYAAKMVAIGRSQAVVEFSTEGTIVDANANFLSAFGYELHEVKGRHHGMFVEPAYRDSLDYNAFWDTLRSGQYQSAQFKRIGKNGRTVWIEGSYNPILDETGKVTKVIKFATDVTSQIALLADLKTLIDRNFGEIDHAMEQCAARAASASAASDETSGNVQLVAGSANELAASIGEIAGSMAKSRTATERAACQADEVSASTGRLMAAAQSMNGIVGLIKNIASQINLLALNATIEAARAGEAGRGFAVVASEVKNLANQAARATEQISGEIEGIQAASSAVDNGLAGIREAVNTVRENVTVTASAVEEQSIVTQGMSGNMQSAAVSVGTVSANVGDISVSVQQAVQAVAKTKEAARILVR